jgi:hypothetical protein
MHADMKLHFDPFYLTTTIVWFSLEKSLLVYVRIGRNGTQGLANDSACTVTEVLFGSMG